MRVIGCLIVSALGFGSAIALPTAALAYALEIGWEVGPAGRGPASDDRDTGKELYIAKGGGGGGGGSDGGAGGGGCGQRPSCWRGMPRNTEAVDMYLTAASLAPKSDRAWRGLGGAIHSLVSIRDWQSAAAIYQRLVDAHGNSPEILAEARNALGPPRRDTSRRGR